MSTMHLNPNCKHTDPVVNSIKRFYDDGDFQGLLDEIDRLRSGDPEMTDFQSTVVGLHKLGAEFSLGRSTPRDFLYSTDAFTVDLLTFGRRELADMRLWRVGLVVKRDLGVARDLVRSFFNQLSQNASYSFYGDVASAYLYEHEGEPETAIALCREIVEGIDAQKYPCEVEATAMHIARLLVAMGSEDEARATLLAADVPATHVDELLCRLKK